MNSNNPFEAHNIDHLSPSAINQFIASPCHWILKISGYRPKTTPPMMRGTIIDDAICDVLLNNYKSKLTNQIIQKQIEAEDRFNQFFFDKKDVFTEEEIEKESQKIKDWIAQGLVFYKETLKDKPIEAQKKIEVQFDELPIPIIGYIDLCYEDHIRDIKTTGRLLKETPSNISRQLSFYSFAEDKPAIVDFLHLTQKTNQVVSREITNVDKHIADIKEASISMMNILSYSVDLNQVASLLFPDFDDWRWSEEDKIAAQTLWRIK